VVTGAGRAAQEGDRMMCNHQLRMVTAVLLGCVLVPGLGWAEEVTFRVTVPGNTPAGESVFIVGDHPGLSEWDPGASEMTAAGSGVWEITVDLPEGLAIEYKYTRGSWTYVEKGASCEELSNRTATIVYGVDGTMTLDEVILNWRNTGSCGD